MEITQEKIYQALRSKSYSVFENDLQTLQSQYYWRA